MPFLLIFIVIPLLEILVFGEVSDEIGFFKAVLLIFLDVIVGSFILRYQGLVSIIALRDAIGRGKIPLSELFDAFCLVAAGALLIMPGFISDVFALVLLIPGGRQFLRVMIRNYTDWDVEAKATRNTPTGRPDLEGDYERLDDDNKLIK
jgi:UPF0716 protein FxsA